MVAIAQAENGENGEKPTTRPPTQLTGYLRHHFRWKSEFITFIVRYLQLIGHLNNKRWLSVSSSVAGGIESVNRMENSFRNSHRHIIVTRDKLHQELSY